MQRQFLSARRKTVAALFCAIVACGRTTPSTPDVPTVAGSSARVIVHVDRTGLGGGSVAVGDPAKSSSAPLPEDGLVTVDEGSPRALVAASGSGSVFAGWSGPCPDSTSPTCLIAATSATPKDVTVTARFDRQHGPTYWLTLLPEGFWPSAIDDRGRIGGDLSGVAAIYDPSTKQMTTWFEASTDPSDWSDVMAMNASGAAVGSLKSNGELHPFVRRADGTVEVIPVENGVTAGEALAIDGAGVAYGFLHRFDIIDWTQFSYDGAIVTLFRGADIDTVRSVSPSGLLVGCRFSPQDGSVGQPIAFHGRIGSLIAQDLRGCLTSVNDIGAAVGDFQTDTEIGAYIWNGTVVRQLPFEVANAITAEGTVVGAKVVGWVARSDGTKVFVTHAVIWFGGADFQDLNLATSHLGEVKLMTASAINDAGQIAGLSSKGGFLLNPHSIPEP